MVGAAGAPHQQNQALLAAPAAMLFKSPEKLRVRKSLTVSTGIVVTLNIASKPDLYPVDQLKSSCMAAGWGHVRVCEHAWLIGLATA